MIQKQALSLFKTYEIPTRLVASLSCLVLSLLAFNRFTDWVESRPGVVLPDPVLTWFEAYDLTLPLFAGVYGAIIFGIYLMRKRPKVLANMFFAYSLLLFMRVCAMVLIPLAPPEGMIPLRDPVVELFGSNGRVLTKDLFFSGHTSVSFLIAFFYHGQKVQKWFYLVATSIGVMVILQKVHYSIDVWAAPFFSYASYHMVNSIHCLKSNE